MLNIGVFTTFIETFLIQRQEDKPKVKDILIHTYIHVYIHLNIIQSRNTTKI